MNNLKCPYCGKKISYLSSIKERADGEHYCKRCKRNSTIYFVRYIKVFIIVICLIALSMLSLFLFTPLRGNFLCVILMFIPFIVFISAYLCLFGLSLSNTKKGQKEENDYTLKLETPKSESGTTRIIQPVRPSMTADPRVIRNTPELFRNKGEKETSQSKNDDFQDISKF